MNLESFRIAVLISGRGSNLQALMNAQREGRLGGEIVLVASNRRAAAGLLRAEEAGIDTLTLDPGAYSDRASYDNALFARVADARPHLIVLAGFMRILDPGSIAPWIGRMINVHPSLLPRYPGLHTHQRALEAGDRLHGASVHFVTAELDGGPVIAQAEIAVRTDDTPEALAERLLPREHKLLVASVRALAQGRVRLQDGRVELDGTPLTAPLQLASDGELRERNQTVRD